MNIFLGRNAGCCRPAYSDRCNAIWHRDNRQIAIEFGAFIHFAEHSNTTLVRLNDLPSNQESKSRTAVLQFLGPVELVENLGLLAFREARATVDHAEANKLPIPTTRSNDHLASWKAIFQCVRNKIRKD